MKSNTDLPPDKPMRVSSITDDDRLALARQQIATKRRLGIPVAWSEAARLTQFVLRTARIIGGPL